MDTQQRKKNLEVFTEVQKLLAMPLMLVNLLLFFLQVISVMFVGHRGELALSGASLATSFAFVTGFSLLLGMGSALETLCGQSMQKAMLVSPLVSIPIVCIWAIAGHILETIYGNYARFMIPSIFAYGLLECQVKFLQAQNNVMSMMFTTGITLLLHILSCRILMLKTDLGRSRGAALANATSYWIKMFLLAAYIRKYRLLAKVPGQDFQESQDILDEQF